MKVAIIGNGNVGSALDKGLRRAKEEVRLVGNEPAKVEAAGWAEVVILAVPFAAHDSIARELGKALQGKIVIDVSNSLDAQMEFVQSPISGAEKLQHLLPESRVVKCFNTVFAQNMSEGRVQGVPLTALVAGDDQAAKDKVLALARGIGFDPINAGPLKNARYLEALGYLNIQLGYVQKLGNNIGFKLVHAPIEAGLTQPAEGPRAHPRA